MTEESLRRSREQMNIITRSFLAGGSDEPEEEEVNISGVNESFDDGDGEGASASEVEG